MTDVLFRCTYRACPEPAVKRLTRSDCATPWYGCAGHWPAMNDALQIGLPGATTGTGWVELTDIDQLAAHRGARARKDSAT